MAGNNGNFLHGYGVKDVNIDSFSIDNWVNASDKHGRIEGIPNCVSKLAKCSRIEDMAMYIDHHRDNLNAKYVNCDAFHIEKPMVSWVKCGKVEEMTGEINQFLGNCDVKDANFDNISIGSQVSGLVNYTRIAETSENINQYLPDVKSDIFSIGNSVHDATKCDTVEEMANTVDSIWHNYNAKDVSPDAFSIDNRATISLKCDNVETIGKNSYQVLLKDENCDDFSLQNLVYTLVKCDRMEDALQIFYTVPQRTVFAWTALIRGFIDCGKVQEALKIYESMLKEGIEPNAYTFVSLFKACGHLCDLNKGKALHTYAQRKGLDCNLFIGNSLISMYGKCGDIAKAEKVFCNLLQRDIVSWNVILSAYLEQYDVEKAIQTYRQIYEEGLQPNARTLVIALQVCCILKEKEDEGCDGEHQIGSLELGRAIHSDAKRALSDMNLFVLNALISMYAKCGSMSDVLNMFSASSHVDTVSWNTLISACADKGLEEDALQLYREMHKKDISPNAWTFVITFQACCKLGEKEEYIEKNRSSKVSLKLCWALHADALNAGFDVSVYVGTTLVKLYGKCGSSLQAEIAFNRLHEPSIVSWNAMLSAYVDQGEEEKCLELFSNFSLKGNTPDELSLIIALQACCQLVEQENTSISEKWPSNLIPLISGYALHTEAQKKGFDDNISVGNALLDMYSKYGSITSCQKVFDHMLHHDIVSWTTLFIAYVNHGNLEKAMDIYNLMAQRNIVLSEVALVCILQACSNTGSIDLCMHIHFIAISSGHDQSFLVANTLIDAYGTCGEMDDAQAVFNYIPTPTVVSWSSLVVGYSQAGDYGSSINNFENMLEENITPNEVTIQAIISVCSHNGSVDECIQYLWRMRDYGLTTDIRHYASLVDLLGRAGDFSKVNDMLMYVEPNLELWLSLLSACHKHGNFTLGKYAFDHVVSLDPENSAAYVLMSNIQQ